MKNARKEKIEGKLDWILPNVSPNGITLSSIVWMFIAAGFILQKELLWAGICVFLSGFCDILDGAIAKKYKRTSAFGSFLDKTADRINDAAILCAVILAGLVSVGFGLLVLIVILLASYMSAVIDAAWKNKGEELSLRWVRLCIIAIGLFANRAELMMFALLVTGLYSFFDRLIFAVKHLKNSNPA